MTDPEFAALCALSALVGTNPLRTQAAGGNTSLKRGGVMWIKASGTWLAEAEARDIFVPVALEPLLAAVDANDERAAKATDFVRRDLNAGELRPSVETSVHAVIPQAVVVHVHCVETVALAARSDAKDEIARRLDGLAGIHWTFVPYIKPGLPLARAIRAVATPETNVIVLGNHGLVVAADTAVEASTLLERVCSALASPRRTAPAADLAALAALAEGTPFRLPTDAVAHDVATDPVSLSIARRGTLYPDHVVFLGSSVAVLEDGDVPAMRAGARPSLLLAVPDKGVLIHRDVLRGGDELARAIAEVSARIPADAPLVFLTGGQEDELVNWDAEIYRQSLARKARAS